MNVNKKLESEKIALEVNAQKERDENEETEKSLEDEIRELRREILRIQAEKDAKESKFHPSLDQVTC